MIATSHVIIGGAVGVAVGAVSQNPALGLATGIASHLVCDLLPHLDGPINPPLSPDGEIQWSKGLLTFAIADSLLAFLIVLVIWHYRDNFNFFSMFAWGAGGGYLPDLVDNLPLWAKKLHQFSLFKQFHTLHLAIHETWRAHFPMSRFWPLGIATQVVTVLPCLWYLLRK
ncbi:MAG TPA: hypothetical protein VFX17_02790 [Patescibacteria group bacterium]|nr:hypothetical protein [Patescibacteria group bacterium]